MEFTLNEIDTLINLVESEISRIEDNILFTRNIIQTDYTINSINYLNQELKHLKQLLNKLNE